jgi:hypothetical protein
VVSYCKTCGNEITFRYSGGRSIPMHFDGHCTGRPYSDEALRSAKPTTCRECGGKCFWIQHNGGSVFVDELGHPWRKHPCHAHQVQIYKAPVIAKKKVNLQRALTAPTDREVARCFRKGVGFVCPRCNFELRNQFLFKEHLQNCTTESVVDRSTPKPGSIRKHLTRKAVELLPKVTREISQRQRPIFDRPRVGAPDVGGRPSGSATTPRLHLHKHPTGGPADSGQAAVLQTVVLGEPPVKVLSPFPYRWTNDQMNRSVLRWFETEDGGYGMPLPEAGEFLLTPSAAGWVLSGEASGIKLPASSFETLQSAFESLDTRLEDLAPGLVAEVRAEDAWEDLAPTPILMGLMRNLRDIISEQFWRKYLHKDTYDTKIQAETALQDLYANEYHPGLRGHSEADD